MIGTVKFCGLNFDVTDDVLRPYREAEMVVTTALDALKGNKTPRVCDIGTGSGNLITSILGHFIDGSGVAVDISPKALKIAEANARKFGVDRRIEFIESDVLSNVEPQLFDCIVCSPPYLAEGEMTNTSIGPRVSYDGGGKDGLDLTRRFMNEAPTFLKPNGVFVVEINNGRADAVLQHAKSLKAYRTMEIFTDWNGVKRILKARKFA